MAYKIISMIENLFWKVFPVMGIILETHSVKDDVLKKTDSTYF